MTVSYDLMLRYLKRTKYLDFLSATLGTAIAPSAGATGIELGIERDPAMSRSRHGVNSDTRALLWGFSLKCLCRVFLFYEYSNDVCS
jgi:hypothetical protein